MRRAMSGEALRIDGDGSQSRHFIFVGDLARAHVLAPSPNAENRTYNLPGAAPVTIREVAETVGRLVGDVEVEFGPSRPGDLAPVRRISSERAKAELGWEPE